mgnify:CR=1 FL=1
MKKKPQKLSVNAIKFWRNVVIVSLVVHIIVFSLLGNSVLVISPFESMLVRIAIFLYAIFLGALSNYLAFSKFISSLLALLTASFLSLGTPGYIVVYITTIVLINHSNKTLKKLDEQ